MSGFARVQTNNHFVNNWVKRCSLQSIYHNEYFVRTESRPASGSHNRIISCRFSGIESKQLIRFTSIQDELLFNHESSLSCDIGEFFRCATNGVAICACPPIGSQRVWCSPHFNQTIVIALIRYLPKHDPNSLLYYISQCRKCSIVCSSHTFLVNNASNGVFVCLFVFSFASSILIDFLSGSSDEIYSKINLDELNCFSKNL